MSRDIKCRGRSIEDGKTWFIGHYYWEAGRMPNPIRTPQSPPIDEGTHWIVFPGFADWNMPREMQRVQIDPKTLQVFTGQKAEDGVELCEGDVVESDYGIGLVKWDESTSRWLYVFDTDQDDLWMHTLKEDHCVILGNICDNPELLVKAHGVGE